MAKLNLTQRIKAARLVRNQKIREMRAKGYTLREVGDKYGVTYEMVRKLTPEYIPKNKRLAINKARLKEGDE